VEVHILGSTGFLASDAMVAMRLLLASDLWRDAGATSSENFISGGEREEEFVRIPPRGPGLGSSHRGEDEN